VPGLPTGVLRSIGFTEWITLHKPLEELRQLHDREKNDAGWELKKQLDATQEELYAVSQLLGYKVFIPLP